MRLTHCLHLAGAIAAAPISKRASAASSAKRSMADAR